MILFENIYSLFVYLCKVDSCIAMIFPFILGHYNHAFFWAEMAPADQAKKTKVSDQLSGMIDKSFGSMDEMKAKFEALAAPAATFGSGWVWVCVTDNDELKVVNTPNQDNPLMKGSAAGEVMYPVFGLDVWGK